MSYYLRGVKEAAEKLAISAEMLRHMMATNPNLGHQDIIKALHAESAKANYPPVDEAALDRLRAASPAPSAGPKTPTGNVTLGREQLLGMSGPQVYQALGAKMPTKPAAPITPKPSTTAGTVSLKAPTAPGTVSMRAPMPKVR